MVLLLEICVLPRYIPQRLTNSTDPAENGCLSVLSRERERERDRQTDRDRQRQTDRQTETDNLFI